MQHEASVVDEAVQGGAAGQIVFCQGLDGCQRGQVAHLPGGGRAGRQGQAEPCREGVSEV